MIEEIINWVNSLPYAYYLQNKYVVSVLILIGAIILAKVIMFIFKKYIERLAKKTKNTVDDMIVEKTEKPIFFLIIALGLKGAVYNITTHSIANKLVDSLMALLFIFIIVRIIDIVVEAWAITFAKKTKTSLDDTLMPLAHKAVRVIFIIVALMWILSIWEINITPYLAGAGIAGLVLGMALQDTMKNVFGGITLILDKTFKEGDKVSIDETTIGTVHEIGLRSTKLVTFDNEVIYVPNGYLANTKVQNYTRPSPKVRVKVQFGVEYGTQVEKVKKTIIAVLKQDKGILSDPEPAVQFLAMGDSSLNFQAAFWVDNWNDSYSKKLAVTEAIYDALNKTKIGIPFPTRTVYIKK
ncbi:MAG: mechanosensitive ion channel family protein [Nanoarchaeota archaeon]|nr:mechanosensitive ion channel family protein [Nanoarchaeota archaeon]MBU1622620.1 mechanosensitive ion channel family protein [Nanoarchaeota archaeon]